MSDVAVQLSDEELQSAMQALVDRRDAGLTASARNPVSHALIRQLTDALGDRNPVYTDEAFAQASIHAGIVAPPTALQVFTLPGLFPSPGRHLVTKDGVRRFVLAPGGQNIPGADGGLVGVDGGSVSAMDRLLEVMDAAGYTSPAVTNGWYEYKRYLRPGDLLQLTEPKINEFVGPKRTALGYGYFVTVSQDIFDQSGEPVAAMRHRFLRFRPPGDSAAADGGREPFAWIEPTEALGEDLRLDDGPRQTTLTYDEVGIDEALPLLSIELTPTLIIATAIATQDYQDVHHDRDRVQRLGHPDVFMNILTGTGFAGRFVTDWAGPEAILERATVRLGVPSYPYGDLVLAGTVVSKEPVDGDRGRVVVEVKGTNQLGLHIESTVTLTLPR